MPWNNCSKIRTCVRSSAKRGKRGFAQSSLSKIISIGSRRFCRAMRRTPVGSGCISGLGQSEESLAISWIDLDVPLGNNLFGFGARQVDVTRTSWDKCAYKLKWIALLVVQVQLWHTFLLILPERIAPNKAFELLLERFECLKDLLGALFHFQRLINTFESRGGLVNRVVLHFPEKPR